MNDKIDKIIEESKKGMRKIGIIAGIFGLLVSGGISLGSLYVGESDFVLVSALFSGIMAFLFTVLTVELFLEKKF